jgi:hypothetical protein
MAVHFLPQAIKDYTPEFEPWNTCTVAMWCTTTSLRILNDTEAASDSKKTLSLDDNKTCRRGLGRYLVRERDTQPAGFHIETVYLAS